MITPCANGSNLIGLAIALALLIAAAPGVSQTTDRPPNVVIVLFDTLRADCIAPYDAANSQTRGYADFAAQSVTFFNAFAPSSCTPTSVATLMTSTHPWTHGCLDMGSSLPADIAYLPEQFRANGYRTIGAIGNPHISAKFGYARGYDSYTLMPVGSAERQAARAAGPDTLVEWVWDGYVQPHVDEADGDPVYLYLHEVDPHGPYNAPPPYDTRYDSGADSDMTSESDTLHRINLGELHPTPDDVRRLKDLYRNEVAYMGDFLTHFVARVNRDLGENTIVVFVSDHGEEFFERGNMQHWMTLHDESIRVPFLIRFPDQRFADTTVRADVGLADIAPTLLDACGLPVPGDFFGRSLMPRIAGEETRPWPVFVEVRPYIDRIPLTDAVILDRWKLIRIGNGESATYQLFDLETDPDERHNRWNEEPDRAAAMLHMLIEAQSRQRRAPVESQEELSPETIEELRALGYVE